MIIKTKQFILRPFRRDDLEDLVRNINDKEIARNMARVPYPYTIKDGRAFLKRQLRFLKNPKLNWVGFAIEIDGEMAGGFYINYIAHGHKCCIGYWLGRKFWGRGLMSKIVKAGTAYAFKKYKLKRIEAEVFPYNPASMRVLVKNGFTCEGVLRKDFKKGRCYLDMHVFAKVK